MSTAPTPPLPTTDPAVVPNSDLSGVSLPRLESRQQAQLESRPTGEAANETTTPSPTPQNPAQVPQGYSAALLAKIQSFAETLSTHKEEITTILRGKAAQGVSEARTEKAVAQLEAEMKKSPGDDTWVKNALVWGGIALLEKIEQRYGSFTKETFGKYLVDRANETKPQPQPQPDSSAPVETKAPQTSPVPPQTPQSPTPTPTPTPTTPTPTPETNRGDAPSQAERTKAQNLNNSLKIPSQYTTESGRPMYRDNHGVDQETAKAFEEMKADAARKGIKLTLVSHYRGYDHQHDNLKGKLGKRSVESVMEFNMPVGYSEHHTGKAIDVGDATRPETNTSQSFAQTPAYAYLKENAARFGFHFSYPEGGTQGIGFEPWHLFYKGKP